MKTIVIAGAVALALCAATSSALAECSGRGAKVGMCPPGTCAVNGGPKACDPKNCKASHCAKPPAPAKK